MKKSQIKPMFTLFIILALFLLSAGCFYFFNIKETKKAMKIKKNNESNMPITNSNSVQEQDSISCSVSLTTETFQTIESFGASGGWWAQKVGGYTNLTKDGIAVRDYVAGLLFDQETGIGLTAYRYNIGAGSTDGNSDISDSWRRAEHFFKSDQGTESDKPSSYDWSKDTNAVWFLKEAVRYGIEDITFFVNSPPVTLTKNKKAHGDENGESKSNLASENYKAFAKYILDVTEHFIKEGIPVRYLSPINEPQWDWTGGQEGCHYEPEEMAACLKEVIAQLNKRTRLKNISVSAPESGEWGNTNYKYIQAILEDDILSSYFHTLDVHSYWSDSSAKRNFAAWLSNQDSHNVTCKTSEWCEMKNGKDYTMDSAIHLAQEIHDDLTILNVTSWQYWIAVSCYDYRDGLLYINPSTQTVTIPKRFYAMGQYSKFIRPGFIRRELNCTLPSLKISAYEGTGEDNTKQLVLVCVNSSEKAIQLHSDFLSDYSSVSIYATDEAHNLECTYEGEITEHLSISPLSVTTLCIR